MIEDVMELMKKHEELMDDPHSFMKDHYDKNQYDRSPINGLSLRDESFKL